MAPDANKTFLFELADALLHSWWTVVAGGCFGLAGAVVALHYIPKVYEASATILISPQQMPAEFFQSTVTEDMTRRMMALEEAQISERSMRDLIEQTFGPQATEGQMQALIRRVRGNVKVRPTADLKLGWLSFELIYRDEERRRAARVVNTLAELYIEQNTDFRTRQARETTKTVEDQLDQARLAFEDIDRRANEFNAQHSFETEAQLDTNLRLLENAKRDLENNSDAKVLNVRRINDINRELADLGAVTTAAQAIAKLEQELEELRAVYHDAHPSVVRKQRALDDLRKASAAGATDPIVVKPTDPRVIELQRQISNIEVEQDRLQSVAVQLSRQIREYERRIQAVAEVQPQLTALMGEHKRALERYQDLQQKADVARESLYLEESRKGARMELAERAEPPGSPVSPSRQRLYTLGLMLGLTLCVGPVLALRMLNPPVSSEAGLRTLTTVPVLVAIPRIATPSNRRLPLRRLAANLGLAVVCAAALVAVVLYYR